MPVSSLYSLHELSRNSVAPLLESSSLEDHNYTHAKVGRSERQLLEGCISKLRHYFLFGSGCLAVSNSAKWPKLDNQLAWPSSALGKKFHIDVGGITTAITLQKQLGFYDYTIYEMASAVGGTWLENTYPGCACDVPTHWYSLSSEPNPDWSAMFSGQAEIRTYWENLAEKHNVGPHIEFYSEVLSAVWDEQSQVYTITIRDTRSKATREVKAQIVVSAVGVFHKPKWPDIPGRESFKGVSMHARMWDQRVDFSGKKVAVIGNGCSATQIVPVLSEDSTTNLVNFCRTPSWFRPRPQVNFSDRTKWIFRNVPLCGKLFRWAIATQMEISYIDMKVGLLTTPFRQRSEQASIKLVKELAPEKYHKNLIPDYPMGCKRIVVDPDYLKSLQRPNLDLEWDPIAEVTETGIVVKSGKTYDFDIICYATGFDVAGSSSMDVRGVGGKSMLDYYKEEGGPTAYMGTTTPGFPNWFSLMGPNTVTGHASVIYSEEIQINYAMQLIEPVLRGKAKSFVPKVDATRAYNEFIQDELKRTVWTGCISWYHAGNTRQGKLTANWPGTLTYMWWMLRKPIWADYETIGGESWVRRRRYLSALKTAFELLVAGAGLGALVLIKTGRWESVRRLVAENVGRLLR
ncbi:FAD/NAD(P)-binding domain-containing protein [Ceratobasidium sp. AG-I]|nr:FAD/NAD(P)-binding domain-containing protein [Ceratobasidium sp. AG-I]